MVVRISNQMWHSARNIERGVFNLRTLRHRRFDGVLVSMQQSGTHWLGYMLSLILARLHGLPPPSHIGNNSIVGNPKSPPLYPQIPQIYHTHCPPHYLLRSRISSRLLRFPRYLILVRDIRDALVSHYEKHKNEYNADFSAYLRGDVRGEGRRRGDDVWVRIRFHNGWGAVAERQPEHVAVLKYEDLRADTRSQLARVCDHFNIEGVAPDLLDEVVAAASKAAMRKLPNPKGKSIVVRTDPRPSDEWYSDADRRFVADVLRRNLKHTFGYQYW